MTPRFQRILVPTDFSEASAHALEYATALAQRVGAELQIVHVVEDPIHAAGPDGIIVDLPAVRAELARDAERRLAAAAVPAAGVPVTTRILEGRAAQTIAAAAQDGDFDLIVMGTHGRGGFAHLLLGSVAERVIRLAPCPVLAVRERQAEIDTRRT